jgi:hypothetical protein
MATSEVFTFEVTQEKEIVVEQNGASFKTSNVLDSTASQFSHEWPFTRINYRAPVQVKNAQDFVAKHEARLMFVTWAKRHFTVSGDGLNVLFK